jgi:hypothetical protein
MRTIVAVLAHVANVAGCSGAAPTPDPNVPVAPTAAPAEAATALVRVGKTGGDRWVVVADSSGASLRAEADGLIAGPDRLFVTAARGDETVVELRDPLTGSLAASVTLPATWALPSLGLGAEPVGVSSDGSRLALVEKGEPGTSSFAILDATLTKTSPGLVQLTGRFAFDALSANGSILYLVEYLNGSETDYVVRAVDVASGVLRDGVIVDKRNSAETSMSGIATARVEGAGWSYTLYDGPSTFIHALDTANAGAVCIDLPTDAKAAPGSAPNGWTLTAIRGNRLLAANPVTGQVAVASLADFTVSRTARTDPIPTADAGWVAQSTASVKGDRVWVTSPTGVLAIDGTSLNVLGRIPVDGSVVSVVALADGAVLAGRADGSVVRLSPSF